MARAEALKEYRARRDFSRTPEPQGGAHEVKGQGLTFVVQKHDATRLHYDFRLELNGVLKSWAVTKGPSLDPSEKRLAVRTEDHPLDYGGFEGTIPEGEYGGGTVMLWDRGHWQPEDDPEEGLARGKLSFRLDGERLKGRFSLVRMRGKPGERGENWLLVKSDDDTATRRGDILKKHVKSVATGRTMTQIAKSDREWRGGRAREKAERAMPRWREPQLATLVDKAPEGADWLAEMKYDGYRALIAIGRGGARIYTRRGKDWTDKFRSITEAAAKLPTSGTLLDAEIVAYGEEGRTDFSTLQAAISSGEGLSCFVFDLLQEDGQDIVKLPLIERKARLEALLGEGRAPLVYSTHVRGHAPRVFEQVCAAGHEGIVVKRADAPYRSGRGRGWLKVKCGKRQELVIGGYTPSDKRGRPFASLLLGAYEDGRLVYRGRVGTGFDEARMKTLADLFERRGRKSSPFASLPREAARRARFIEPELVAEIAFTEFTGEGMVRHGVFKGLREDKDAREVTLERPQEAEMQHETRTSIAGIKLTNPGKVLFDAQGVTKADIAAHYERVAERMMPLMEERLVSLVRCPEGSSSECFFQRHGGKGFPKAMKAHQITEKSGGKAAYLLPDGLAGIVAGVQMGTLEFHIWGSRVDRLEQPDRLVFDLDPDEGLDFADVRQAAFDLRERLAALGLNSLPLVTGGKGVHVVVPLARRAEWPQVKAFARAVAQQMAAEEPERFLAQASKAKRKGRIFVDWLRNERGATAIAPYSTRAKDGAPIATPVSWEELKGLEAANRFRITDMEARLKRADPWAEGAKWRQSLIKKMLAKVGAE